MVACIFMSYSKRKFLWFLYICVCLHVSVCLSGMSLYLNIDIFDIVVYYK